MGAACATVEKKGQDERIGCLTRSVTELVGLKNIGDYNKRYMQKEAIRNGGQVAKVVCKETTHLEYICRKVAKNEMPVADMGDITSHCQVLAGLEHPHLCKFVEAFHDHDNVYMIYESADPTTLFEHIRNRGSLQEEDAADYARQITMALSLAHEQNIVHGRLSPRSVILSPEEDDADEDEHVQVKVCDMGQGFIMRQPACRAEVSAKSMEMGRYTTSPELAWNELPSAVEGMAPKGADKTDIWALGTIMYHMLTGAAPFSHVNSHQELVDTIKECELPFVDAQWSVISPDARDAVQKMLKINPGIRISAVQLLRHPWLKIAKVGMPRKKMLRLLHNLRMNINESEFKRFVLRVIAEQLPKDLDHVETIEEAFRALDRNGDGVLTVDEVVKGLQKYPELALEDLEHVFQAVDRDGSGSLNVQEFVSVTMDQKRTTSLSVLWQAFNAFDKDQGGSVSFDEIDTIVCELEGGLLGKEQVTDLCTGIRKELETNLGGQGLDFDQFVYMMSDRGGQRTMTQGLNRDVFRICWNVCKHDCYKVRNDRIRTWQLSNTGAAARSPRSVYRRRRKQSVEDAVPRPASPKR